MRIFAHGKQAFTNADRDIYDILHDIRELRLHGDCGPGAARYETSRVRPLGRMLNVHLLMDDDMGPIC